MKFKDLKSKTASELQDLLLSVGKKIAESRFYHVRARSKNVKEAREWRRMRARILTLFKEKNI